jgi:hypothetical protein
MTAPSPTRTIRVRISPTIAGEFESRCPEDIAEHLRDEGVHDATEAEVRLLLADAEFNSDPQAQTIGPDYMPLGVFNAYRALAKQLRAVLA